MKNDIIHKAKILNTDNWVKGVYYSPNLIIEYIDFIGHQGGEIIAKQIDENTISMQSPEKDNMGMEIYENDIIEINFLGLGHRIIKFIVKYGYFKQDASWGEYTPDDVHGFYCVPVDKDDINESRYTSSLISYYDEGNIISVIGNVFDNPELFIEEK